MVSQAGHPDCPLQVEGAPVQQESLVSSNLCNVRRLLLISQLPSGLFCFLQLPSPFDVSDGRYISFSTTCVANIAKFLSFEIKFCFCDEASFDFSASEASFGFSASEASCGFAPFGVSISTNRVSNIFSCSCSLAISSQENPLLTGIRAIDAIIAMSGYISFIRAEECGFVHKSIARSRQSRSEELYLAVWTESELTFRWSAASSSTKDIFRACWLVVSLNSFKIRPLSLKSIIIDPLNRRKSEIRYKKWGSARVRCRARCGGRW